MKVYITTEGKKLLAKKIQEAEAKFKNIASQKGDAYENGGNGWHDNFAFEQLVREETMVAGELASLSDTYKNAIEVAAHPPNVQNVVIGTIVTFEDEDGEEVEYQIAGYGESNMKSSPKTLEYLAPIIFPFYGESIGAEHSVRIGGRNVSLTIKTIRRIE